MNNTNEINKNHYFWHNQGNLLMKLGKLEDALDCLDRAIAMKDNYYEAWWDKGYVLEKLGRFTEGEICFNKSLGIFCDDLGITWEDDLGL